MTTWTEFDGIRLAITWKPIRHLYLRVLAPDGTAAVSAPLGMARDDILRFVAARAGWLRARIAAVRQTEAAEAPDRAALWGSLLPVRLLDSPARHLRVTCADGEIIVSGSSHPDAALLEKILDGWRRAILPDHAAPLLDAWRSRLRLPPLTLACRTMKSRWGSCIAAKNKITLNSQLTKWPKACLELVIVHELIHFYEPNHGKGFYKRLEKALPDWRERALKLKNPPCGQSARVKA